MDTTPPSEGGGAGSIPAESTKVGVGQRRIDVVVLNGFARIYKKPVDYCLK